MNILAIGNSFSQDANRYFYGVAKAAGVNIFNANIFIGGCPLERHFRNMMGDKKEYDLELMGVTTGFKTSIKEALLSRSWDVVTLQQASHFSAFPDTYTPYVEELARYVRALCPKAKVYIHQTWAYEDGSARLDSMRFPTRAEMFASVKSSYATASERIAADGIIPSGEVMERLTALGIEKVHRDTFHANLGVSRYALALTWLEILLGISAEGNSFREFDFAVTEEEVAIAQKAAHEVSASYKK